MIEGSRAEGLDLFSFHSLSILERCAASAEVREAVSAFEAAGGRRVRARSRSARVAGHRLTKPNDSEDKAFFHGPIGTAAFVAFVAYALWRAKQKQEQEERGQPVQ